MDDAHARFASIDDGRPSQTYPALAQASPELFGICVVGARGGVYGVGDDEVEFTIMSVAKPFVFALICAALGPEDVRRRIGLNATGLPFNSLTAIEQGDGGRTNPMVNSGAIATTSLTPGATIDERWRFIADGLSRFAGRQLALDEEVYRSASETNFVNRSIANLLESRGALSGDPADAVDLYTRQSCLAVSARDLATMGATLALGGVNPLTGERVVDEEICRHVLAVMTTAGLYQTSGDWLYDVGLPGKSGIGGGIITVAPGKGGLATFAPPLDQAGNSVRGQLAAQFLSRALGLDLWLTGRAGSAEESSPSPPARVGWQPSRRLSTRRETACADSLPLSSCRARSGWTSSCHGPKIEEPPPDGRACVELGQPPAEATESLHFGASAVTWSAACCSPSSTLPAFGISPRISNIDFAQAAAASALAPS